MVVGMLEAADGNSLDIICPFIGAILYLLSVSKSSLVTLMSVKFVELYPFTI